MNIEIAERFRSILSYAPDTGILTNLVNRGKNKSAGMVAGYVMNSGYVLLSIENKRYYAHRVAWLMTHNEWPIFIDHINGIRSDNRLINLRSVSRQTNMQNQRSAGKRNSTGYLGVTYDKRNDKFVAQIVVGGSHKHIGSFDLAEQAHSAYVHEKRLVHLGCTI